MDITKWKLQLDWAVVSTFWSSHLAQSLTHLWKWRMNLHHPWPGEWHSRSCGQERRGSYASGVAMRSSFSISEGFERLECVFFMCFVHIVCEYDVQHTQPNYTRHWCSPLHGQYLGNMVEVDSSIQFFWRSKWGKLRSENYEIPEFVRWESEDFRIGHLPMPPCTGGQRPTSVATALCCSAAPRSLLRLGRMPWDVPQLPSKFWDEFCTKIFQDVPTKRYQQLVPTINQD